MKHLILTALASMLFASPALAQVTVTDPWVRGTVAQQRATGAFMKLTAPDGARLVEARSPVAGVVEIHEMTMDNNVMRMRQIPVLELPAGKAVELKPGGFHVMLMDLKSALPKDSMVPVTLLLKNAQGVESRVELKLPVATGAMAHKH